MSIFNYMFDSEWAQRADIEALKMRHRLTQSRINNVHREVLRSPEFQQLGNEIGELALFCRTAIALMIEKGLVTREEFMAKMKEIDISDGVEDGQYRKKKPKPKIVIRPRSVIRRRK